MGDFRIKRIQLPSGKYVEIVYFHADNEHYTEAPALRALEHCPECKQNRVYPTQWAARERDDSWDIVLRCPDCQHVYEGNFPHAEVERFDEVLNRGTDQVIDDLEILTQTNMQEWIDLFSKALEADQIQPMDF